jgi:hypothetical protein
MSPRTVPTAPLEQHEFTGLIGVARVCIDPPEGMYARTWGSASHDIAEGQHRPLYATALAVSDGSPGGILWFLTADLMVWMSKDDEAGIRAPLESELGCAPGGLIMHLSHSHGAPFSDPARADAPGGHLIAVWREALVAACRAVLAEARAAMRPAVLGWSAGRCGLAYNRDLPDPETGALLCGLNPEPAADDTLLVGRVTDADGAVMAVLVNYACHPTSTGGGNRLISPDYIGALREIVEREAGGICVFLHGADGELTPRRSFEDDVAAADQNGRELGYAAMAVLAGMFPPGQRMEFAGREESGTALGRWRYAPARPDPRLVPRHEVVRLDVRNDLPPLAELRSALAAAPAGFERERAARRLAMREKIGDGATYDMPLVAWRLGGGVMFGAPVELYSDFQIRLRARHPGLPIAVMNICNGYLGYLPPREAYSLDVYPVRIALFAAGGAERALDAASAMIDSLMAR